VERDGGEPLQPTHLARIQIGGEDDPADQRRRHDRRGHQLAGTPFENGNARDVPVIERVEQGRALVAGDRGANARDPTFRGHDEGASNAEPRCHVSKGGLHCRLVAAGYSSTKAEVAREQLSRILQLPRPLLPQPVVDRATRLELALDLFQLLAQPRLGLPVLRQLSFQFTANFGRGRFCPGSDLLLHTGQGRLQLLGPRFEPGLLGTVIFFLRLQLSLRLHNGNTGKLRARRLQ